jgi:hypothetical protein
MNECESVENVTRSVLVADAFVNHTVAFVRIDWLI